MPTRENAPAGAPCWIDLMTSDTERSRTFYCELFGWGAEEPNEEFGGYFNYTLDGVRIAGCMANQPGSGMPDVWAVYLACADAKQTVDKATASGGTVQVEPMAVADLGTMAVVEDPSGAGIGVWQPGNHPGFRVLAEPSAPGWFELFTRDHQTAVDFYRDVFGLDTGVVGDSPEFHYTTLQAGGDDVAGIMDASGFLPEGVPAHWSVYFAVDDTDASLAKIGKLEGSTVMAAEDTPYGRLATATDPTGAQLKLIGPNKETA